jgi:TPR repeat protein
LMKRGRSLLTAGDIPSARLILTRLADGGEAEASLLLAGTFDPAELARLHVIGAEPDVAQARAWYAKAAEQGSPEGSRRLQQLALR